MCGTQGTARVRAGRQSFPVPKEGEGRGRGGVWDSLTLMSATQSRRFSTMSLQTDSHNNYATREPSGWPLTVGVEDERPGRPSAGWPSSSVKGEPLTRLLPLASRIPYTNRKLRKEEANFECIFFYLQHVGRAKAVGGGTPRGFQDFHFYV